MKKNTLKRILSVCLCAVIVSAIAVTATGCAGDNGTSSASSVPTTSTTTASKEEILEYAGKDAKIYKDTKNKVGYQLDMPAEGEEVAIMHTSMGDICLRFFPEAAPKTVENFLTHAKNGYYDGLIFHRVIEDFMIQGGDPNGTGTGGESIYGKPFEDEFSDKLFNIRGSVAMANSGKDTNGSQFFINQGDAESFAESGDWEHYEAQWQQMYSFLSQCYNTETFESLVSSQGTFMYNTDIVTDDIRDLYSENGGNPYLDGAYNACDKGHTVFAQVYKGMDIVDKIAEVDTDDSDKPEDDVTIKSIEVTTYKA